MTVSRALKGRAVCKTECMGKVKPPQSKRAGWRAGIVALAIVALVGGILAAFDRIGSEALERIGSRSRYRSAFADIQCEAPPGLERSAFLTEVRYLADSPESFHGLDETERTKLAKAFALHPWVEAVEGVLVQPGNVVAVRLKFREPVLAVHVSRGDVRLVDAHGILLPQTAPPTRGVAELLNVVPAPSVSAGTVWPDDTVQQALDLVKTYKVASLELTAKDWRLVRRDGSTLHVAR